jgi:hypothetical protein
MSKEGARVTVVASGLDQIACSASHPKRWQAPEGAPVRPSRRPARGFLGSAMLKCWRERYVCAPRSTSLGTSTSPRLSSSFRIICGDGAIDVAMGLPPSMARLKIGQRDLFFETPVIGKSHPTVEIALITSDLCLEPRAWPCRLLSSNGWRE